MTGPDHLSPCAADALFGTRMIIVAGKTVGIAGFDKAVAAVRARGITGDAAIMAELLRRIMQENYIPTGLTDEYAQALLEEFKKVLQKPDA